MKLKERLHAFTKWTVAWSLLSLLAACGGNECYENHSALPLADFYSASTLRPVTMQRLEIYGIGAPGDSVLYSSQSLSEAYLPFRIWEDSTQYVFAYHFLVPTPDAGNQEGEDDEVGPSDVPALEVPTDTVTFRYQLKEWFVSPACGAMYFYEMGNVTHTSLLIDSIACNSLITNENSSNIKIFFKEAIADE